VQATKVSVLIPCFNRKAYIRQAIDSVLTQTATCEIEIIVVDDGSSDGSYELLQSLSQEGLIKLFAHPNRENRGQSASLNKAISEARGEYICILDSDDYLAEDKIESQLAVLENDKSVGMVYGNGQAVDEHGSPLFKTLPKDHYDDGDPSRILLDCFIAIPGGALIRKSVLDKVGGFDETYRAAQDHDMAIRIYEATKVVYLPKVAFFYRKHGDSISQVALERRWRTGFVILERAGKRWPYSQTVLRKRRAVLHYRLGQVFLSEHKTLKGLAHYCCSAWYDPIRSLKVVFGRS
jgi:glycosyltransferase involved in cell wall biosynthesis